MFRKNIFYTVGLWLTVVCSPTQSETLIFFGNEDKPPKIYLDNGRPKGILVDILDAVRLSNDFDFIIKLYPWNRSYNMALQGKGGIIGFSKNEERLKLFDYTVPMYFDENVLVVLKGREFKFEKMEDLKSKRVAYQLGASYGADFEDAKKKTFLSVEVNSPVTSINMLLRGHVDASIIGGPGDSGLNALLNRNPELKSKKDQFQILDKPISRDPNYIGFAKSMRRSETIERLNEALFKLKDSEIVRNIVEKYADQEQY